jgi:hypothetical protein
MAESINWNNEEGREEDEAREEQNRETIEREEERLRLLEQVKAFDKDFGHWSMREHEQHSDRMRAVTAALGVIEAALQDDEERMRQKLDRMAFEMGYRIEKGRFEDSASPERLADIERSIEASRKQSRENLNP